jgi:hypothetical protein
LQNWPPWSLHDAGIASTGLRKLKRRLNAAPTQIGFRNALAHDLLENPVCLLPRFSFGKVTRISADLTKEQQTNEAYFLIRITLPETEVRRLGELKLVPGMPAEVFVQTGERTPLQYLLKPLREQIARTFRER